MARKKRNKQRQVFLDKYKIGLFLIFVGFLYFFAYFFAQTSPLMKFLQNGVFVILGEAGAIPFFLLVVLLGVGCLVRGYTIKKLFFQFFLLCVFLSAILNFPIIETAPIVKATHQQFITNGGYLSMPLLWVNEQMFGYNPLANKTFVILLFVFLVGWIFYTLNLLALFPSLPKIRIQEDQKPKTQNREKKHHTNLQAQSHLYSEKGNTSTSQTLFDILFKRNSRKSLEVDAGTHISANQQGDENVKHTKKNQKEVSKMAGNDVSPKKTSSLQPIDAQPGGSLFGVLFKEKLLDRIQQKEQEKTLRHISYPTEKPTFPIAHMESSKDHPITIDEEQILQQAKAIEAKLLQFNVPVTTKGFDVGPSVIQIRVKPEAGIKVSTIENLKNDIALSIKSKSLRIVAPIPGTDCVGIQIPNPYPHTVYLADLLGSPDFLQAMAKSTTNLALGTGIDGKHVIRQLEKMPHLLIAGATGSGKSVGINDFVLSLIYQNTPDELKFIMIDPKQVELEFYNGIPYLLAPIITEPQKALKILQRSVLEMEARYNKFKEARVKNIEEYNEKFPDKKVYRIVIVIDELADLMMSSNKKEVELCITRIAQKARAVGMHLIVATQRPSVNVITGLIKANIPTRIAFSVFSQVDSRTILDMKGAEDLVGKGDFLYMDPTIKTPLRIQAPFISTKDTEYVIGYLKETYMKDLREDDIYHPDILALLEGKGQNLLGTSSFKFENTETTDEELVEQAIHIIMETRKASATMLQRKLNIGFARAARIMDILEERGIVGPADGAKPREILL